MKSKLVYGSRPYRMLLFARSSRRPFSVATLQGWDAVGYPSDIRKTARRLIHLGYLEQCDSNTWQITPEGVDEIYRLGAAPKVAGPRQKHRVPTRG